MKKLVAFCLFSVLMLFGSCASRAHEESAVQLVKSKLSISTDLTARKLSGGASSASVFLVTSGSKNYVVKLFKNKYGECEIYNSMIASEEGYGPKVYFSDASQESMISEYLSGKKISKHDLESDDLYISLAHLLQKIHYGKELKNSGFDVFRRIDRDIQESKLKCEGCFPLSNIERLVKVIQKTLLPHVTKTPCHNDLHGGNLVFLNKEFKAIDYGDASPGDPYFDIATVANDCLTDKRHDQLLLEMYLGRKPSPEEKAKLYLMKQLVWIKWACDRLRALSAENLQTYPSIQTPSIQDFFQRSLEGKVNLERKEECLACLKVITQEVFKNAESQDFLDAVTFLNTQET